jgi:hypothetical protein
MINLRFFILKVRISKNIGAKRATILEKKIIRSLWHTFIIVGYSLCETHT